MRFAILLVLLCSCAGVPNSPVCFELEPWRGYCVKIVDQEGVYVDDENLLDGKTWFDIRPSMILIPANSWADIKSYILKNCKRTGKCSEIDKFTKRLDQNK